jgi:hypothetical protein
LQRGPRREREEWIESANFAVDLLCRTVGRARFEFHHLDSHNELIDGTGWEIVSVNPPERHIQHDIVCRPA